MNERIMEMSKPLLEEFGIPLPETIESCNLIGLDYGDEEISANLVLWDEVKQYAKPVGISLSESGTLFKNSNAYYISPNEKRLIYDARGTELMNGNNCYHNFIRCIGTVEAAGKYVKDDGTYSNLTYQEVMAEGFNIAINTIFKSDVSNLINYDKPTIILVSCPSGEAWEKSKIEYANLLKSRLKLPEEVRKPVYVAVYNKFKAVLAQEFNPRWGKSSVQKGEAIVSLDNGYGTFGIAVAGADGIPENGVDSYQFGENLLDKNLLEIMQKRFKVEYPEAEPATLHGHELGIRIARENYYGLDGERREPQSYMVTVKDKTDAKGRPLRFKFEIDDDVMEEALKKMPVTAFHYTGTTGEMEKKELLRCDSWLDGCRQIYQSFYDKMKGYFVTPGKDEAHAFVPDRIALSGGVSIMPEVQEVVEEVFGVKPVMSAQPTYAVSEGLAYVLSTELITEMNERDTKGGITEMNERDTGSLIPLLEEFGIPLPETIESCNLIGLDYGDGEISANLVLWDEVKQYANPVGLSLSESGTLFKNPNAYLIGPNIERLIYDARETELMKESTEDIRYYNFKKCIGTVEAASKFVKDDGTYSNLTYQEVMAEGFNIAINTIFKSDVSNLIDYDKPTIILVGCPSSAVWERDKLEYADLLKSRLQLPEEVTEPVYVAIYKESNAVLAREIDPNWGKSRVKKGEVIVILDNGSSTFDITVVGVGGIPENGVDSYQFGGNLLDKNLLEMMQKRFEAEYPDEEPGTLHGHKLGIRIAKENYYGLDGELRKPESYMVTVKDKTDAKGRPLRFKFEIDEYVMDEALEKMPVTAFHYAGTAGEMEKKEKLCCDSWLDGCRQIYQSFYEKMKGYFVTPGKDEAHNFVPDRIVLSGGVSVMPEVQEVVKEVFGVEPVMSTQPNYAVSEGLAYVLITEIRKGQYLQNVLDEIQETLPIASTLRDAIVKAGCEEDWMTFSNSLKKWSEQSGLLSLRDWNEYYEKEFNHNLTLPVQKGAEDWFKEEKIQDKVSSMLAEHFKQMFPDYEGTFEYTLPERDFKSLSGVKVSIDFDVTFFFGFLTSNEDKSYIITDEILDKKRDQAWRKKAYQNFLEMEDKIRKGGNNSIPFRYEKSHFFGWWTSEETGYKTVSYKGLETMYKEGITDDVSEKIRKEVLKELKVPLKEYVEMITPYFQMTARG